jgi:hypothetical protein
MVARGYRSASSHRLLLQVREEGWFECREVSEWFEGENGGRSSCHLAISPSPLNSLRTLQVEPPPRALVANGAALATLAALLVYVAQGDTLWVSWGCGTSLSPGDTGRDA